MSFFRAEKSGGGIDFSAPIGYGRGSSSSTSNPIHVTTTKKAKFLCVAIYKSSSVWGVDCVDLENGVSVYGFGNTYTTDAHTYTLNVTDTGFDFNVVSLAGTGTSYAEIFAYG